MLNYIEKNLNASENVVYKAHKSLILLLKPALFAIALIVTGFLLKDTAMSTLCALAGGGIIVISWLLLRVQELVITNRRIACRLGVIRRSTQDCPLDKVDTIQVERNFWGMIFGYGTVVVKAMNGTFSFKYIVGADKFRNMAMNAIEQGKDAALAQQANLLAMAMKRATA